MRLFVAIELEDRVRSCLGNVQTTLARLCEGVRWIPPHQLHLTLKFLGDVADQDVAGVASTITRVVAASAPFAMSGGGCGCFPPGGAVRIVWAGVADSSGVLERLAGSIDKGLSALGFPTEDRGFSPHVTIGRAREDRSHGRLRAAVGGCSIKPWQQAVASVTLMSSVLSRTGPMYAAVHKTTLGSGAELSERQV